MATKRKSKCICFVLSIIMVLSMMLTANTCAQAAETQGINIVNNGDMENAKNWWYNTGSCSIESSSDAKHGGSYSIKAKGRTAAWQGIAQDLGNSETEKPLAGKSYHAAAWVMFNGDTAPDIVTFKLSIKRNNGTEDKYDNVSKVDVAKGQWTELKGDYILPADTDISKGVHFYTETDESTATFVEYFMDDASLSPADARKMVALTFDDGPDATLTPLVLEKLEKYKVPATFMQIGEKINDSTKSVEERIIKDGCEIGNHSWSYTLMDKMTKDQIQESVTQTTYAIKTYAGVTPVFFRAPNLVVNDAMFDAIDMTFVSGVTANDWDTTTTAEQRANAIINGVKDGSIILLHDVQPLPHPTPEALDIIIPALLDEGYEFVTLSELFKSKKVELNKFDKTMYVNVGTDAPNIVVPSIEVVKNGGFESDKAPWYNRGDASIEVTSDVKHGGSSSLKITGRKQGWQGAAQNIGADGLTTPEFGVEYTGSAWVMYNGESAPETMTFNLSLQWNNGTDDKYDNINQATVKKGEWTKLEGKYTLNSNALIEKGVHLYAETTESAATDNATCIDFYLDDVSFKAQGSEQITYNFDPNAKSLRSVWDKYFPLGIAITPQATESEVYTEYMKHHYSSLVAENCMKPEGIQPAEGKFTFSDGDKIANFAQDNGMNLRYHTLQWHSQTPDWFFTDPSDESKPASSEKLLERLKTHIETIMTHYNGKIHTYDVVNEVISDGVGLRDSKWRSIVGDVDKDGIDDDFILSAFKFAFDAAKKNGDDKAKFCINDYSLESNNKKLDAMYDLVKRILKLAEKEGISKDRIVVGFQMHISMYEPSIVQIRRSLEKFRDLGIKVQVTELDISIYKNDNEPKKAASEDVLQMQAKKYKDLFELFKVEAQNGLLDTVTIWGTDDGGTWKNDFPVKGRTDPVLLFDKKLQAKPAYTALTDPDSLPVYRQQVNVSKATPVLGNELDKLWSTILPVDVSQSVYGSNGATAKVKSTWDDKNLYIVAQIDDKTTCAKDSFEIFIDTDSSKSDDNKHITINSDKTVTGDVYSYIKSDNSGYTVQVAVPFSNIAVKQGDKIGIDFRVNDFTGDGTLSSTVIWNDYKNKLDTDTTGFGYVLLDRETKLFKVKYGTPTIDANIDNIWSITEEYNTDVWVFGTSGSHAKFKTLWDDKYLYVLTDIKDSLLSKKSTDAYQQDSVELFIDQNNGKTSYYEPDDYQMRVNFDNETTFDHGKPEGFNSATKKTETGYLLEVAIPFTAIKAEEGKVVGFDIQINNDENDDGTRDTVSIWCDASGNSWTNISGIGNIILGEKTSNTSPTPSSNPVVGSSSSGASNNSTATAILTSTPTNNVSATPSATVTPTPSVAVDPKTTKPAAAYSDIMNHWAKDIITELATKNLISGYSDGTIRPSKKISRAELTTVIIKALGIKPSSKASLGFADSKSIPAWAAGYVAVAKEKGIVTGFEDNTFRPGKECTREEAVAIISRAFKLGESNKVLKYKDAKEIKKISYKLIAKATELKVISGYPNNTFRPGKSITRAEVFAVLYRCLNK